MSCCNTYTSLGCHNYCDTAIDSGYNTTQTGVHSVEISVLPGIWKSYDVTLTSGDDIEIDGTALNENTKHVIKVKLPDDTYFEFGTTECATLTTHIEI